MTSRSPSLLSSKARSLGIGTLLVLVGAVVLPVPGCTDEPTPRNPNGSCDAADLENSNKQDCQKPVCQNGMVVNEADDTEIPDDGSSCTTDTCSGGTPQHAPATGACMVASAAGTCVNGECKVTCAVDADCNDNNSCTNDTCDTASSTCSFPDNPASYDDNNDCTLDSCTDGVQKHDNAPVDTKCGASMNGKCDGNGVCKGCAADTDCPNDEPCVDHYCDLATTQCQSTNKPDEPLPDDMTGDCKLPSCSGGQLVMNVLETDVPDDSNECTVDTCVADMPMNTPAPVESICTTGVCNDASMCVECVTAAHCMSDFSCSMNMCFDCNDGTKNGTESDIDCGRDCLTQCADGKMCADNADCGSSVCDTNVCVSCGDGTKNGTESDIDCGGMQCPKCNTGQNCNMGSDCAQGVCNGGKCASATCMDGVKNGAESDVDCGGSTCPKCAAGKMCTKDGDCANPLKCNMGICG